MPSYEDRFNDEPERMTPRPPEPLPTNPLPPAKLDTSMQETKPAIESKTVQTGIVALLISAWPAVVAFVAAIAALLGLNLDTAAWLVYADDGEITAAEWLYMGKDILMLIIPLLVIRYRKEATTLVSGWFKRDAA